MNELGILLAWMIIPFAFFMVYYAVRDIWLSATESDLSSTLQRQALHRKRPVG